MPVSVEQVLITLAGSVIFLLLTGVAFFLKRTLEGIASDIRLMVATVGAHSTEIALAKAEIANLRERLRTLEEWRADMGGFLANLGFKRREGT
jgi:hypothetical protein